MTYKFSPSSLKLLKDCERCFWLHFNKKIRRPSGIFPSLPGGMDKILKAHFDTFRDKDILPPELDEINGKARLFSDKELLKTWRSNFKGIQWTDMNGNLLRGAVDEILQKGKKLIVLDYKTRGYPLKENTASFYQDQMDIYNFLLRKNGFSTENYSYLLFYYPDKVNSKGDVIFHTELVKMAVNVKNAENIFKKAVKVLEGPEPNVNKTCDFCSWSEPS